MQNAKSEFYHPYVPLDDWDLIMRSVLGLRDCCCRLNYVAMRIHQELTAVIHAVGRGERHGLS